MSIPRAKMLWVFGSMLSGVWVFGCPAAYAVDPARDLVGAFVATYHQAPPFERDIDVPSYEIDDFSLFLDANTPWHVHLERKPADLAPARLVRRHGHHYALVVRETLQAGARSDSGAVSVAYLTYDKGWTLEKLWPEVAFMGMSGIPFKKTRDTSFSKVPVMLASSTDCGMNQCSENLLLFGFSDDAPRFVGSFAGDAKYNWFDGKIDDPDTSCQTCSYTATIGPAKSKRNFLSVTYAGFTAPPGKAKPKRRFKRTHDFAVTERGLVADPEISLPNCGM